jgi:MvaI/BcnI restriction endonuclease family
MNLTQLKALFVQSGARRLFSKTLASNDNSKNQVYFGPGLDALHLFQINQIAPAKSDKGHVFKVSLPFGWLAPCGNVAPAPFAQLILYPQYPEVRFSGFLKGCENAPSELMTVRRQNRILFLGITDSRGVVGYFVDAGSEVANEFESLKLKVAEGVFSELDLPRIPSTSQAREQLLAELGRIHRKGWINSKQLAASGALNPCNAPQCGGFTLEAELGIAKNSKSSPDFMGWEIKQHGVRNLDRLITSDPISLMTPEPDGGYYGENAPADFVRKYGYADKKGIVDRLNFGGRHFVSKRCEISQLCLKLDGYDLVKGRITNPDGCLALISDSGEVAASWSFSKLIKHWSEKHALAVYVPSIRRDEPERQYAYGAKVRLAQKTDAYRLLQAMATGVVFYDPSIKLVNASSSKAACKPRGQFRTISKNISSLYENVEIVSV